MQQIQATRGAFAAILADGSVVAWGAPDRGGDSSAVQDQLKNVQQIQATGWAFAAILADGSVVSWGLPAYGAELSPPRSGAPQATTDPSAKMAANAPLVA